MADLRYTVANAQSLPASWVRARSPKVGFDEIIKCAFRTSSNRFGAARGAMPDDDGVGADPGAAAAAANSNRPSGRVLGSTSAGDDLNDI